MADLPRLTQFLIDDLSREYQKPVKGLTHLAHHLSPSGRCHNLRRSRCRRANFAYSRSDVRQVVMTIAHSIQ